MMPFMTIMKKSSTMFLLLFFIFLVNVLHAFTIPKEDLDKLKGIFSWNEDETEVKVFNVNDSPFYLIGSKTIKLFDDDTISDIQADLEMQSKAALYSFLRNEKGKDIQLKISGLQIPLVWHKENVYFSIAYIPLSNVSTLPTEAQSCKSGDSILPDQSVLSHSIISTLVDKKIEDINVYLKTNRPNLTTIQHLCELYKIKGDIDGHNSCLDMLIRFKFSTN